MTPPVDDTQESWHFLLGAVGFTIAVEAIRDRIALDKELGGAALYALNVNAGFAIECASKAFIRHNGGSEEVVRKLSHCLIEGIEEAERRGLTAVSAEVKHLAAIYDREQTKMGLRYPRNRNVEFMENDDVAEIVKSYTNLVNDQSPDIGPN